MKSLFISLMLFFATTAAPAAAWTTPLTIERAFTEDSDLIVVYTTGAQPYTAGCDTNR